MVKVIVGEAYPSNRVATAKLAMLGHLEKQIEEGSLSENDEAVLKLRQDLAAIDDSLDDTSLVENLNKPWE